ncbi:MAG: hypothetical protein SWH78_16510 [Thermodesulfobacteriota bacterium]|nr:hypothetical protein [Thermodesulfobacteriota bacterium]
MDGMRTRFGKPAVIFLFLVAFACACSSPFSAETELWFGTYTDEKGKICQGRYIVKKTGQIVGVQLAPYGLLPIDFVVVEHDTSKGFLKMQWPGNPQKRCALFRYHRNYYAGNWIDGTSVQPMVIKKFDRRDAQLQGKFLGPSEIEIRIVDYAKELLSSEEKWNRNDNRVCVDESKVSLFCALYRASIAADGEYRHKRPAVEVVRDVIVRRHPRKYGHILMEFNNLPETSLEEVRAVLEAAKGQLIESMKHN